MQKNEIVVAAVKVAVIAGASIVVTQATARIASYLLAKAAIKSAEAAKTESK